MSILCSLWMISASGFAATNVRDLGEKPVTNIATICLSQDHDIDRIDGAGQFASSNGWTNTGGGFGLWVILPDNVASGSANASGDTQFDYTNFNGIAGHTYEVVLEVVLIDDTGTGGWLTTRIGNGGSGALIRETDGVGVYTQTLTAINQVGNDLNIELQAEDFKVMSAVVSNVTVHDITPTVCVNQSNLTAILFNAANDQYYSSALEAETTTTSESYVGRLALWPQDLIVGERYLAQWYGEYNINDTGKDFQGLITVGTNIASEINDELRDNTSWRVWAGLYPFTATNNAHNMTMSFSTEDSGKTAKLRRTRLSITRKGRAGF